MKRCEPLDEDELKGLCNYVSQKPVLLSTAGGRGEFVLAVGKHYLNLSAMPHFPFTGERDSGGGVERTAGAFASDCVR